MLQRLPPADDGHLSAGPPRYMRELERDVSCSQERDPRGQLVEVEKGGAREQILVAGNAEVSRLGSGSDHEVRRIEHLAIHRQPLRTHEPRGPMIGRDPSFLERLLPIGRHGISEGSLELHQFGPGDMRVATHSPALHPTVPVHELRGAHEHFLGITAAQRARPAVWKLIHNGDAPAGSPAPVRRRRPSRAGADYDQIEWFCHRALTILRPSSKASDTEMNVVSGWLFVQAAAASRFGKKKT